MEDEMRKKKEAELNYEEPMKQEENKEQSNDTNQEQFQWDEDLFKKLVQTSEGAKEVQRLLDKGVTKGIDSWKANNLQNEVEAEIERRFPTDPKEKEILKLKTELATKEVKDNTIKLLEANEIPISFSNYFVSDNLETTEKTINDFVNYVNQAVKKEVDNRLRTVGHTPRMVFAKQRITKEDLNKMSYGERAKLYETNPELFR